MVIRYRDILEVITVLSNEKGLNVTISESLKGSLIAGGTAGVGGLLLGPPGLAIGGALGGCLAAILSRNKFKSVTEVVLYDMTREQQGRLVAAVTDIVKNLDVADAVELMALLQGNDFLKARILTELVTFVRNNMGMRIDNNF